MQRSIKELKADLDAGKLKGCRMSVDNDTTYLIDADGDIVWEGEGYDDVLELWQALGFHAEKC